MSKCNILNLLFYNNNISVVKKECESGNILSRYVTLKPSILLNYTMLLEQLQHCYFDSLKHTFLEDCTAVFDSMSISFEAC